MDKYECPCGYVYDPEEGDYTQNIAQGTAFKDLPDDWLCPTCQAGKDIFTEVE
ncbi:MAG: rubredoxin [Nitrospirota bacterium]